MSRILLLANLNCDHVLSLSEPLVAGARLQYLDRGRRLGGGAANTGIGLVWAGHEVAIASRIGLDDTGDWLLAEARSHGLECSHVERFGGETGELLILVDSTGERTILRQPRRPDLPGNLPSQGVDCLYVNYPGGAVADYMRQMQDHCLVVAQYPKGGKHLRPCHLLVASRSDLGEIADPWAHARALAGEQLQWLVLTEGKAGAVAIHGEERIRVAARPVSVVDTTGAGDAFAAGLIHGLARGMAIEAALQCAVDWGAFAVASQSSIPSAALKSWLEQGH
ncbi:PfkB family carbohydrate kinase [Aeromonas rivuli]|uniref:PfkB family carbohydrate kinase n=1 Tax=Aeromonas rivuli TaxID=648794 RepID=UPI001CCC1010|nr:PfkB family carbohydrate kinase [Aeromonas rivuli]UBO74177.1 carbohydrate kinase [Aeromonas rivuli]